MTHAVNMEIRRFYRVYVQDNGCSMTDDEIVEMAKKLVLDDESVLQEDEELEIEPHDILCASYGYSFDGLDDDEPEQEESGPFRYYLPYRPPMPGAIPKDGIVQMFSADHRKKMDGCDRPVWGWVEYDRKLTRKEIDDYELIPAAG